MAALRTGVSRSPGVPTAAHLAPMTVAGGDGLHEVPALRWAPSGGTQSAAEPTGPRHGGFLHRAEDFDAPMFGASPAEVVAMDPQQRLLLEAGYDAAHGAVLRRAGLLGRDVGVFVGLMNTDVRLLASGSQTRSP